ncbi:MAG: FAD-dependent oxidoreductase [Clostridia bacterium]|nr:FAD-dependent oxidoreductase [Clostridia bacterium]
MYDVMIIGGGPAGLTAGLYAARAGLKAVLLEQMFVGGQASTTDKLENYPGFPEGVGGPELMMQFEQQAVNMGLEIRYEPAESLELTGEIKRAKTMSGEIEAKTAILCMGAGRSLLGVPGEQELTGRGVSYCATCDGALHRGKRVAVVGGGDTAMEDVLYLARICEKVTLIHRRDQLRAVGRQADAVRNNEKVDILYNSRVEKIEKTESGVTLHLNEGRTLDVSAVFVAIGTKPESSLAFGQVEMNSAGFILAGEDTHTSVPGVFAAGDLRKKPLRQVVTAASDGAVAAYEAQNYLMEH